MGHWVPVGVQKLVILEYKHKTMQFKGSPCQTILDAEAIATIPSFHSSSFEINHLVAHDNKISEWLEGNEGGVSCILIYMHFSFACLLKTPKITSFKFAFYHSLTALHPSKVRVWFKPGCLRFVF